MTNEDFKELSKWVVLNNKLLQVILLNQVGEDNTINIVKELIEDTEKEFKKIEKERNDKNEEN